MPPDNAYTPKTSALRVLRQACLAVSVVAALTAFTQPAAAGTTDGRKDLEQRRSCAVVYFDLGETLIHSADDGTFHYLPEAARHLRELRKADIDVGLITNVPPEWGESDAERAAKLREIVDADWTGAQPFAWEDFEERIFTPRTVAERKPSPVLFERAKDDAGPCHVVYQGETPDELDVARDAGYFTYRAGRQAPWPAYLPVAVLTAISHLP